MKLTSPAFQEGATVPKRHTCDGPDLSPQLAWSDVPQGTRSLALLCDDPDAPGGTWVHWVLYDLPPTLQGLPEDLPKSERLADGSAQGMTDFRRVGYGGPCPPPGKPHRYSFRLYALSSKLGLAPGRVKGEVVKAMQGLILAQAELTGKYGR